MVIFVHTSLGLPNCHLNLVSQYELRTNLLCRWCENITEYEEYLQYNSQIPPDLSGIVECVLSKGSSKKVLVLVARPLRGGRGVRAWPLRKKNVPQKLLSSMGGGRKALVVGPLKQELFSASLKPSEV